MFIEPENICRLCLNVATNEFAKIDEIMKHIFDILLLKLDLNKTIDPIICWDCVEIAKKCLKLKATCLTTERIILSFSTDRAIAKHNIKVIYKERGKVETVLDDDLQICRICMTRLERNKFASLDTLRNELTMFVMLAEYMSEMDVSIVKDPIVCTTCIENLDSYFKFVANCLDTERKVTAYCKVVGNENMGQIKLGNVLQPEKYSQTCAFKEETNMFEDTKCVYREAYHESIKLEQLDIKDEVNVQEKYYEDIPETGLDKSTKSVISSKTREGITKKCTYQKIIQANIMEERLIHEDTLKFDKSESSDIQIEQKGSFKNHLLFQHDISKIKLHKCLICTYETKIKNSLKRHMLVHKDISEIDMYKCSTCNYETKHKRSLKTHMLVHKAVSEIGMHKCSLCTYETKYKAGIKTHMLVHNVVSEVAMYKCSSCTFETKRKSSLRNHMLVHRIISEKSMHKCSVCAYESKHKRYLKYHMLVHQDISETKIYKCSICTHVTKFKGNLKNHMLVHKDVSEVDMHKCSMCTYETKLKDRMKKHMLVHKDVSEVDMHKCPICTHVTKYKACLKSHMLVHKDVSEIDMHKCSMCTYETKHKCSLRKHILTHKDVSQKKNAQDGVIMKQNKKVNLTTSC